MIKPSAALVISILCFSGLVTSVSEAQLQNTVVQLQDSKKQMKTESTSNNIMDELDPFANNITETLQQLDKAYESETGLPAYAQPLYLGNLLENTGCVQLSCQIYAQVVKSEQKLYLYINGTLTATWLVSTGVPGRETPLLNTHPDGRIYESYTSTKFPGGDYEHLGNMPYAVFIQGGFAIHGTGTANWPKLGHKASHGCVRIHPDNAKYFNGLVRTAGVENVWVSVQP